MKVTIELLAGNNRSATSSDLQRSIYSLEKIFSGNTLTGIERTDIIGILGILNEMKSLVVKQEVV